MQPRPGARVLQAELFALVKVPDSSAIAQIMNVGGDCGSVKRRAIDFHDIGVISTKEPGDGG